MTMASDYEDQQKDIALAEAALQGEHTNSIYITGWMIVNYPKARKKWAHVGGYSLSGRVLYRDGLHTMHVEDRDATSPMLSCKDGVVTTANGSHYLLGRPEVCSFEWCSDPSLLDENINGIILMGRIEKEYAKNTD